MSFRAPLGHIGHDLHRDDARPQPLAGALRALRRHADDRARRDDRERRAALDPGRPRLLAEQPRLGRQRLPDRLRRPAAARRPHRRPDRPAPHLPDRPRRLHRRLAAVRGRPDAGDADRRALRPGRRRRADLGRDPRDDRDDVPRAARAGEGDRRLRLRRLRRRLDRPAGRRRPDRGDQLALDLLHQPADRHRHRAAGALRLVEDRPGHRPQAGADLPGAALLTGGADARRLHDPQVTEHGWGSTPHARARRRRRSRCSPPSSSARRGSPTR